MKIKGIIAKEDTRRPLSDQKIADILKKDGLIIARRTVAKYREQLGVLPARHRKQY
jgi:RNA polymerase sigma-54 factor